MYGVVEEICLFFNYSPKRQQELQELQEHIENLPVGTTSKTKLINLCKTRWIAQIEAFEVFRDMLPALAPLKSLAQHMAGERVLKRASALLISITQFQFLMSLEVTWAGLGFIKGLIISLQGQSKDICCAYNEIVTVKEALSEVRSNIDTYHKKLYDSVVSLGGKINALPPSLPRRCTQQTNRENVPSNTPEEYFRRAITIPFFRT